jgi:hypothetical protein
MAAEVTANSSKKVTSFAQRKHVIFRKVVETSVVDVGRPLILKLVRLYCYCSNSMK